MKKNKIIILLFIDLFFVRENLFADEQYKRSNWGHGWADLDKDCQNTRAEVLILHTLTKVQFKSKKGCVVKSGYWDGLFTDKKFTNAQIQRRSATFLEPRLKYKMCCVALRISILLSKRYETLHTPYIRTTMSNSRALEKQDA